MYNQYPMFENQYQVPFSNMNFQNTRSFPFSRGITSGVSKPKFNWSHFLNNTQKTLGIINQAIPIVYQVRPILSNAKTMFKIATALEDVPVIQEAEDTRYEEKRQEEKNGNQPQFFL